MCHLDVEVGMQETSLTFENDDVKQTTEMLLLPYEPPERLSQSEHSLSDLSDQTTHEKLLDSETSSTKSSLFETLPFTPQSYDEGL